MFYTEEDVNALIRRIATDSCIGIPRAATVYEIYGDWKADMKSKGEKTFQPINFTELQAKVREKIDSRPPHFAPLYETF